MPWRTVKPNISLNVKQKLSQTDLKSAPIRAKPNELKIGKSFAQRKQPSDLLFQTADASARGRVIKKSMLAKVSPRENSPVFFGS